MSKTVRPIIEDLFASAGPPCQPVNLSWRLIRRKGRPFMLLPARLAAARTGLNLYSAQRWPARLWRAALPWLLQSPAAKFFEEFHFTADSASEIMRFIAQQTGADSNADCLSAIKLSEVGQRARLVLLLCDESGRPTRVIKAGLNAAGQQDTNREADFLEKLPAHTIGCIRMTGRINHPRLAAFATDYFPGESPQGDAGMEHLFHAWLNPGSPVALESLPSWQALAAAATGVERENWQAVQNALAGKTVRTTLYHGDFTPWNVRVISSQNLEAFDWERGQMQGIPGWDWFHFIIQTSLLARRYSTERTAAEVEQLIYSDRFKKYAAAAGISDLVQPLVLAYLLNHRLIIQPLEGRRAAAELFEFLSTRWQLKTEAAPPVTAGANFGLWAEALNQLQAAASQVNNLFWEPSLNSAQAVPLRTQLRTGWPTVLLAATLFAAVFATSFQADPHVLLVPFYLIPCALLTWKLDRRWGFFMALAAAAAGPLVQRWRHVDFQPLEVMLWNIAMHFVILNLGVLFLDRVRQQQIRPATGATRNYHTSRIKDNWAVFLVAGLWLASVVVAQLHASPNLVFMPLYLIPCVVLTLWAGRFWGSLAVVFSAVAGPVVQGLSDADYAPFNIKFWNVLMRLVIFQAIILLLSHIHREHILFFSRRHRASRAPVQS